MREQQNLPYWEIFLVGLATVSAAAGVATTSGGIASACYDRSYFQNLIQRSPSEHLIRQIATRGSIAPGVARVLQSTGTIVLR